LPHRDPTTEIAFFAEELPLDWYTPFSKIRKPMLQKELYTEYWSPTSTWILRGRGKTMGEIKRGGCILEMGG